MKNSCHSLFSSRYLLLIILWTISTWALSHPEDEFCEDAQMDPLLCAQLAELDRPDNNQLSDQLPIIELDRSPVETAVLYTNQGILHIIPMGLDHLAFVLALVLSATTLRNLVIQISLFTLAHSVTLILSVIGVIVLQGVWIEVAIAFSIAFVAFENILLKSPNHWRSIMVFCFGLLHGLGFAGALNELGIPNEHFISALVGFNLGVEIAQVGFAMLIYMIFNQFKHKKWYRTHVTIPGSLMIGALGCFWVIDRLF